MPYVAISVVFAVVRGVISRSCDRGSRKALVGCKQTNAKEKRREKREEKTREKRGNHLSKGKARRREKQGKHTIS